MRPQVLGELLEVQQTVMVDVTLEDYLWGRRQAVSHLAGTTDWLGWDEWVERVDVRLCR